MRYETILDIFLIFVTKKSYAYIYRRGSGKKTYVKLQFE
jgi:hypothetical protein